MPNSPRTTNPYRPQPFINDFQWKLHGKTLALALFTVFCRPEGAAWPAGRAGQRPNNNKYDCTPWNCLIIKLWHGCRLPSTDLIRIHSHKDAFVVATFFAFYSTLLCHWTWFCSFSFALVILFFSCGSSKESFAAFAAYSTVVVMHYLVWFCHFSAYRTSLVILLQLHGSSFLWPFCRISLASVLVTVILLTGYAGMRDRHVSRAQLNRKYVQGAVCWFSQPKVGKLIFKWKSLFSLKMHRTFLT